MDLSNFSYSHIYWIFLLPLIGAGADIITGWIKDRFKEWCDISSPELVAMDYAPETADGAFSNIPQKTTNNYEQLSTFITARLAYVDSKIAELAGGNA